MPVHPQAQALIDAAAGAKPTQLMTIEEAREALEQRARLTAGQPEPVAEVKDVFMPGPGGSVRLRVYRPTNDPSLPGLVFFHGGGWVRGSLATHDVLCRSLANAAECVVVSVDYRLAPEHPFPAAIDDAWAATRWVAANAAQLGIDPNRLAIGGDSAGGNLSAAVTLLAREQGGPKLVYQVLIYPVVDYNLETQSYRDCAEGYILTREAMIWYWKLYLADVEANADDVRASPMRARDLGTLPPALVVTAEYDPLRDEGRAYADRLQADGSPAEYREYPGLLHGFATSAGVLDLGRQAVRETAETLRAVFSAALVAS
jgi:acetyl esterase